MSKQVRWAGSGDDDLCVIDHGGSGRDVLLIPAPGFTARTWDLVAPRLTSSCHVYAVDLPGHGQSRSPLYDADDVVRALSGVVTSLGLNAPVVAGLDIGGHYALCLGVAGMAPVSAVVSIGALALHGEKQMKDIQDFVGAEGMEEVFRHRFGLGAIGEGKEAARHHVDGVFTLAVGDWLLADMAEGLRREVAWSILELGDDQWIHQPTPQTVRSAIVWDPAGPWYPRRDLYRELGVPMWVLVSSGGQDGDMSDQVPELPKLNRLARGTVFEGGITPQYTEPSIVAGAILTAVREVDAEDPDWTPDDLVMFDTLREARQG